VIHLPYRTTDLDAVLLNGERRYARANTLTRPGSPLHSTLSNTLRRAGVPVGRSG
jgi:hypothetical protein